jgi:hypothetical protein
MACGMLNILCLHTRMPIAQSLYSHAHFQLCALGVWSSMLAVVTS